MDTSASDKLSLQDAATPATGVRALVVGEVLWDRFPDTRRLGGAPLNFAAHFQRLGHAPLLLSAVGTDALGEEASAAIEALGVDPRFLQRTSRFATGTAVVCLGPGELTSFTIERPAAYDALELSEECIGHVVSWQPAWIYYGTLFPAQGDARAILERLLDAVPGASRFYDVNLRPGFESPELVDALLSTADVVKLNERELRAVHEWAGLPADPEGFCRAAAARYEWRAVCVTLGSRGCAMLAGGDYITAPGVPVDVADPVGAGDAFAAAFVHGLASRWPIERTAGFANHLGALVAGLPGAIPPAA